MSASQKLIDWASGWVNYLEKRDGNTAYLWTKDKNVGSNNYTCFAYELAQTTILNGSKQAQPWCACFVLDGFYQNWGQDKTLKALSLPTKSAAAGCYYFVNYLKTAGKYGSTPKIGALIFFKDSDGDPCHIGIVYGFDSTYVYTIEGNTSSTSSETVIANGGGVYKRKYSRSYSRIHGYGYPDYSVLETTQYTEGWVKDSNGWWYRYKDGTYPSSCWKKINNVWYYFDKEGYAVANQWIVTDGNAYYLDNNCKMVENRTLKIDASGKLVPAGTFYYKFGDVTYKEFREVLDILVKKGALKGESGTGDDMVINLSEEAVRMFVIQHRLGLF